MDKYQKVKVLGKGSFGSAILIKRKSDGASFVVKEVSLLKMSKKERDEARHECTMLQQMQHPNIVRYVEQFENRNNLYIVMEYCDGGDLAGKIKQSRGPMRESAVLYYFSQICLAMEYMHSRHILHRDIKTMNVFLMKSGAVKLGDFGISTVLRNTMGMANTVCGTPYYFSPELCRNKPYNNKSDIWALGVLLYECATGGRHPFDGNSMNQLMQRIVKGSYAPLSSQYSSEFRKMVDWCLQKEPSKRPSIKQLLALPLMKRALETLEENLMLATQCRVRLKDIIDFDVESHNSDRSKSPTSGQSAGDQRSKSPYSGMSPGQAAAMALQQQRAQSPTPGARPSAVGPKPSSPSSAADPRAAAAQNPHAAYQQQVQQILQRQQQQRQQQLQQQQQQHNHQTPSSGGGGAGVVTPPSQPHGVRPVSPRPNVNNIIAKGADPRQALQARDQPSGTPSAAGANNNNNNNHNNNNNDRFQADMKRVDAIIAKYGQNVDPKAKETIHAYMRRKQEEYARRQKEEQERRERKNELRQKELNRVLAQQRNLLQNHAGGGARSPRSSSPTATPRAQSPSPEMQQHTPEPRAAAGQAFGRDPKLAAAHINNNHNNNNNAGVGQPYARPAAVQPKPERRKVVAANSPQPQNGASRPQSPQNLRPNSAQAPNDRLTQEQHLSAQERLRAEAHNRVSPTRAALAPVAAARPSQLGALEGVSPRPQSNPLPARDNAKSPSAPNLSPRLGSPTSRQQRAASDARYQRPGQLNPITGQRMGGGELVDVSYAVPRPGGNSPASLSPVSRSPAQEALDILRKRSSPASRVSPPPQQLHIAPSSNGVRAARHPADDAKYQGIVHETPSAAEKRFLQQQRKGGAGAEDRVSVSTLDTLRGLRDAESGGGVARNPDQLALLKQRHSLVPEGSGANASPSSAPRASLGEIDRFWRDGNGGGSAAASPPGPLSRPSPLAGDRFPSRPASGQSASPARSSPTLSPPQLPSPSSARRSSVDGYGEMLQHLKELLQKRKIYQNNRSAARPVSPAPPSPTPGASLGDPASPPALLNTKQPRLRPLELPAAADGMTSDEEVEEIEDDEDFEDAVPLSPVRHAVQNDQQGLRHAGGPSEGGNFYTEDVFLGGGGVGQEEDGEDDYSVQRRRPSPRPVGR